MDLLLKKIQFSLPWTYPFEIKRLIPKGSTILDVGCGDGHLMGWINSNADYKVVGVDINKDDLGIAKKRRCLFSSQKHVYQKVVDIDLTKKFSPRKKFDVVLCSQTVEHFKKNVALKLIKKLEKLAKKRIIIATINGFFQFDHREPNKHDIHLSGWSADDFIRMRYRVLGHGLGFIYKPGALKDTLPKFFSPLLFLVSFLSTPILRFNYSLSHLLIAYKDVK